MRVGHRNTNQILSFAFHLLLGAFAESDPQTVLFSGVSEYEGELVPLDPEAPHPHAGRPCVEKAGPRRYHVNFAIQDGPPPRVYPFKRADEQEEALMRELRGLLAPEGGSVSPSDILVMAPTKEAVRRIQAACEEEGITTHVPLAPEGPPPDGVRSGHDPRDQYFFQPGKVTVSTIKSAKGHSAPVCLVAFAHELDRAGRGKEAQQCARAELYVACTRSTLVLDLFGVEGPLLEEAEKASQAVAEQAEASPERPACEPGRAGGT
jgi:superfamily I DNA/RNA helicase